MIYFYNKSLDPCYNLAYEEYFFRNCPEGETVFGLWQNDNTIVIGRNQNPHNEINAEFVKKHGIKVVRRLTGGGAVYHDMGNVNFSFIAPVEGDGSIDFSRFTNSIIAALASFGVKAENQGRNDIAINGFKISGNAQHISGGRILHHGTLLFDSDLSVLGKCLVSSQEKLAARGVSSVRSRVANIKDFGLFGVSVADFIDRLREFIAPGEKLNRFEPDIHRIEELKNNKYATWEWVYGASPDGDMEFKRRFENVGSVAVNLSTEGGVIKDCRISGDFFGNGDMAELEKKLTGVRLDAESIRESLEDFELSYYINGMIAKEFCRLFE